MKSTFLVFFLFLFSSSIFCQINAASNKQYISDVTHYTLEDGLSHNQIEWIHQDHRGMIWVGAQNGINRFDGKEFKFIAEVDFYFTHSQRILEDHEGDLWLKKGYAGKEVLFFNTITEEIKTFEEKFGADVPFSKNEYERAALLQNGTSIIGTKTGQLIFYNKNKTWEVRQLTDPKKESGVRVFSIPNSNEFWVRTYQYEETSNRETWKNSFLFFDKNRQQKQEFKNPYLRAGLTTTKNGNIICADFSNIYYLNQDGSFQKKPITEFNIPSLTSLDYYQIAYDENTDRFWIPDNGKVMAFSSKNGAINFISDDFTSLNVSGYFGWLVDGENFWVGSINGLFKIQLQPTPFKKLLFQDTKHTNQNNFISCRKIDSDENGNTYIANRFGVEQIKKNGEIIHLLDGDNKGLFYDGRGHIYSSHADYVFQINLATGQQKRFDLPDKKNYNEAWSFFQDHNNRIWFSTPYNIYFIEENSDSIQTFTQYNQFGQIANTFNYGFYEDQQKRIWLTSDIGLFQMDLEKGIVAHYHSGDSTHFLPTTSVRHIHQDKDGIFWLASQNGLIRWDKENNQTQLFTTKDGLSHNHLHAVYESSDNNRDGFLWLSSDNGLMQFEKKSSRVKTFLPSDGITHHEFNRISHHQAKDGSLYFGGLNGVTSFHPRDFAKSFYEQPDFPLVLTECLLYSGKTNQQENQLLTFQKNEPIVISPNDRFLKLKFALLEYKNTNDIEYSYAIDEEKQGNIGAENSINIGTLPYGNHIITIEGIASNGLVSKNKLQIPVEVLKPFYLQWWFLALSILTLGFGIFIFQKRKTQLLLKRQEELEKTVAERTKTISKQAEELRELDKTKSRFLANISHEFRTPLTLILNTLEEENIAKVVDSLPTRQVGQDFTNGKFFLATEINIMQRNTKRLQTLIEQLLDLSKLEANKMNLQASKNNFSKYLKNLVSTFEGLAKKQNIQIQFLSPSENIELYFDREKMDKIIYNLLGNAIKFTPHAGFLTIHLQKENNQVFLKIKDTGIGISQNEIENIFDRFYQVKQKDEFAFEGTGLGLALVKELTELHHGKVKVESEVGQGTAFTLSFPLGKNHLNTTEIISPTVAQVSQQHEHQLVGKKNMNHQKIEGLAESQTFKSENEEQPILLIIEDNEDLRYHQSKVFKNQYQILLAKDGAEGLEMAFEKIPDLIICDVMMPKKNGYEVCEILKKDERTNHIPFLLLTAKATQEEKIKGLTFGADDYLVKPYHQKELNLRLQNLLEQTRRLQNQFQQIQPVPKEAIAAPPQDPFILKIYEIIEHQFSKSQFNVEELSNELRLSRSQLFRKTKALTGKTPTHLIRSYRLEQAKILLENSAGNASEISYMVGFGNPTYFHKCFKSEFGVTPKEFANSPKSIQKN